MADFSRYTNYKDNAGVSGIIFGANRVGLFYLGYRGSYGIRETTSRLLYIPNMQ